MARKAMKDDHACLCCGCVFTLYDKETYGLTCCCCVPIRCGTWLIAFSVILLTIFLFCCIFFQLLNEEI